MKKKYLLVTILSFLLLSGGTIIAESHYYKYQPYKSDKGNGMLISRNCYTKTVSRNKKKDFCEKNGKDVIVDFYEEISKEEYKEIEESKVDTFILLSLIALISGFIFLTCPSKKSPTSKVGDELCSTPLDK